MFVNFKYRTKNEKQTKSQLDSVINLKIHFLYFLNLEKVLI